MHVEADVVVAHDRRLTRVDAHADAERQPVESSLAFGRCGDGVIRAGEREEERVALRVDLVPRTEGLAEAAAVLLQRVSVRVRAELGEQARRLLDVGEEEGHGAARQLSHLLELSQVTGRASLR